MEEVRTNREDAKDAKKEGRSKKEEVRTNREDAKDAKKEGRIILMPTVNCQLSTVNC
ncbi:MAG: hypothetical protein ACMG55_07470 [Microcoleus sp.]